MVPYWQNPENLFYYLPLKSQIFVFLIYLKNFQNKLNT